MVGLRKRHWRGCWRRRIVLQTSLRRGADMSVMAKVSMLILFLNSVRAANRLGLVLMVVLWNVLRLLVVVVLVLILGSLWCWRSLES